MIAAAFLFLTSAATSQPMTSATITRIPVQFSGGHDIDPRDHGRPVALVAGALGVTPDVFRQAFSVVHPAPAGLRGPTGDEARENKRVLLSVLGPYGVTNDRLDEVSNYYRYVRSRGEMWPTREAKAEALLVGGSLDALGSPNHVSGGKIVGFEIKIGGSGYTTPPSITVPGIGLIDAEVKLAFTKQFSTNGSVSEIKLKQH